MGKYLHSELISNLLYPRSLCCVWFCLFVCFVCLTGIHNLPSGEGFHLRFLQ